MLELSNSERERSLQPSANVYAHLHLVYAVSNGAQGDDESGNQPDKQSSRSSHSVDEHAGESSGGEPVIAVARLRRVGRSWRQDCRRRRQRLTRLRIPFTSILAIPHCCLRVAHAAFDETHDPPIRQTHEVATARGLPTTLRPGIVPVPRVIPLPCIASSSVNHPRKSSSSSTRGQGAARHLLSRSCQPSTERASSTLRQ
ncbi:hypothetical protein AB1N83_005160 [Pleurotus pulmonarius]